MRRLNLNLDGREMLTKEQMKQIAGGSYCNDSCTKNEDCDGLSGTGNTCKTCSPSSSILPNRCVTSA